MNRLRSRLDRACVLLIIFAAWEVLSLLGARGMSSPLNTARRAVVLATSGDLWQHASYTLTAAALGFVAGAVPGLVIPFVLRRFATVREILAPFVAGAYGAPKVALAPLFVLWFGIGIASKIVLVASIVFFLVFYITTSGLDRVDPGLVDSARVFGANERWIAREIVWPSSVPYAFAGLRIAAPHAIGGAVVGELISSNRGLGYLIQASAADFDPAGVFVGVGVLAGVVFLVNGILVRIEKRLLAWRPEATVDGGARSAF